MKIKNEYPLARKENQLKNTIFFHNSKLPTCGINSICRILVHIYMKIAKNESRINSNCRFEKLLRI